MFCFQTMYFFLLHGSERTYKWILGTVQVSILIDFLLHFSQESCHHLLQRCIHLSRSFQFGNHFMKARWTWRSLSCHTVGLLSTSIYSVSGTDLNGSMGLGGLEGRFISLIIQGLCFVTKAQVHWNREITCSSEFSLKAVRESVQYFRSCSFRGWGLNYAAELPRGGGKGGLRSPITR